jgi:hypothetical protein
MRQEPLPLQLMNCSWRYNRYPGKVLLAGSLLLDIVDLRPLQY